jgi:hypothetical protein
MVSTFFFAVGDKAGDDMAALLLLVESVVDAAILPAERLVGSTTWLDLFATSEHNLLDNKNKPGITILSPALTKPTTWSTRNGEG